VVSRRQEHYISFYILCKGNIWKVCRAALLMLRSRLILFKVIGCNHGAQTASHRAIETAEGKCNCPHVRTSPLIGQKKLLNKYKYGDYVAGQQLCGNVPVTTKAKDGADDSRKRSRQCGGQRFRSGWPPIPCATPSQSIFCRQTMTSRPSRLF